MSRSPNEAEEGQFAGTALYSGQTSQNKQEFIMNSEWQLQEAKDNLSQLIKDAASGDAQVVTVLGKPTAVAASAEAYATSTPPRRRKPPAAQPHPHPARKDLDFTRSPDTG